MEEDHRRGPAHWSSSFSCIIHQSLLSVACNIVMLCLCCTWLLYYYTMTPLEMVWLTCYNIAGSL